MTRVSYGTTEIYPFLEAIKTCTNQIVAPNVKCETEVGHRWPISLGWQNLKKQSITSSQWQSSRCYKCHWPSTNSVLLVVPMTLLTLFKSIQINGNVHFNLFVFRPSRLSRQPPNHPSTQKLNIILPIGATRFHKFNISWFKEEKKPLLFDSSIKPLAFSWWTVLFTFHLRADEKSTMRSVGLSS